MSSLWRLSPFSHMTLRWRLVLAFLSVSMVPVLLASLAAAQLIAGVFHQRMEHWLDDASRFVVYLSSEDQTEAGRAATIVARTLGAGSDLQSSGPIELSTDLLTSLGYDIVAVYDASGQIAFWHGPLAPGPWLPRTDSTSFMLAPRDGGVSLLLSSARRFEVRGQSYFVFIADEWDREIANIADTIPALQLRVFSVSDAAVRDLATGEGAHWAAPAPVLARLGAGEAGVLAKVSETDSLATGFAALRDGGGNLVGIVACRLSNQAPLLVHVRTLELFMALSVGAGLLSLLVAMSLSKVISRPLSALTVALRRVREGDYRTHVTAGGGRELAELASGFNDMTDQLDQLRQREALVRRREQLAALGEAAAVIAHEIRNPLGIITTSSQVLRMKADLAPDNDRLVGFVLEEVGRIDQLVEKLLDYVRPRDIEHRPFDLVRELTEVLNFTEVELSKRGIQSLLTPMPAGAMVSGDAVTLRQAILNIILNAIEALPDGGRITTGLWREDGELVLSISDSGTGVPAEIEDRIFEPFVTSKPRGTGLGLARVRHVMEQHGGSVLCRSHAGLGTTFVLRLPAMMDTE